LRRIAKCSSFYNGTAANSLALASLCQSYHVVICSESSHVETDECGRRSFFSNGSKLPVSASADGKLTPEAVQEIATRGEIYIIRSRVRRGNPVLRPETGGGFRLAVQAGGATGVQDAVAGGSVGGDDRKRAWLRNAAHANACARYFAEDMANLPGMEIAFRVQANAVFIHASGVSRN
jgi:threonine aldolase